MNINEIYDWFLKSNGICTDTRKLDKGNLFVALKGDNFNGNKFAQQAVENGAIAALVDEKAYENSELNVFYVPDGLQTLQDLANFHRNQLQIPIIGLTGSNGKTTTKELIAVCLEQKYKVVYTHGNLNNHIGVPLTLLSIDATHEIAVVEMGANHKGEIADLCQIAQPDFGYITNFGKAHLEGFGGFEGVIAGKSELYNYLKTENKTAFVNADDSLQIEKTEALTRITFGFEKSADFNFDKKSTHGLAGISFEENLIQSNLSGTYNEANLAAAATIAMHFGVAIEQIQSAVKSYFPKINRSQEIEKSNKKILLDAYNANPTSMEAALKNFDALDGSKTVILGDMFELGNLSLTEHHNVVKLATKLDLEHIYAIGKEFMHVKLVHPKFFHFPTKDVFLEFIKDNPIASDRILIKGSRGMALETLLDNL